MSRLAQSLIPDASFRLTQDVALDHIGAWVHFPDVGRIPVPEAAGQVTLIGGNAATLADDDELFAEVKIFFDAFYQAFSGNDSCTKRIPRKHLRNRSLWDKPSGIG